MSARTISTFLASVLACGLACGLAAGCAPTQVSTGSDTGDSSALGGTTSSNQPLTDAQYVSYLFGDSVHLSSRGVRAAKFGGRYSDTLAYDMPDDGITLDGYAEASPKLNIPYGSYTDVAMFTLHKSESQVGGLSIDVGDNDVSIRLARRDVGSTTVTVAEWNGNAADLGNVTVACDYNIAIFPGGVLAGENVSSFDRIKFAFDAY